MNAKLFFIFLALVFVTQSFSQTVRINEFMALNSSTLTDEDGDYSDWIELYNSTSNAVDISGWSLTDEIGLSDKWIFPKTTISANEYLVLFASGKNHIEAGEELHTNFKLSADGEYLALLNNEGTIVNELNPTNSSQQADISFNYNNWVYIPTLIPTPGFKNEIGENDLLPLPQFSRDHGFYENSFKLEIFSSQKSAKIYYTTDGSEPSIDNGTEYVSPILINTTAILRAISIIDNSKSKIITATYLFLDDVIRMRNNPPGYPTEWGPYTEFDGNAIADYEMDQELLRMSNYMKDVIDGLLQIPTMSIVTNKDNLFSHSTDSLEGGIYIYTGPPEGSGYGLGKDWERPASVEYFNSDGSESFQIDCALQLHGGHSRRVEKSPKHSFKLLFKNKYGPSKLNYPIFGNDATDSYNSIVLRAGYGNSVLHSNHSERKRIQLIRDKFAKETQLAMGHPAGHGIYVHLYLNGIYWGIYNPTERINDDFAESYLGGASEDYDVIKDNAEVLKGNKNAWNEMMSIANSGLIENTSYQLIQGNNPDGTSNDSYENYLDLENFIDYMLINYYGSNWDWDTHNWIAIRNRLNPGKGFKFFSWDAEHLIETINASNINNNYTDRPSRLFHQLIKNNNFKKLFSDRVQKHLSESGVMSVEKNINRWIKNAEQIDLAIIAETARWGDYRRDVHPWRQGQTFDLYDKSYWEDELDYLTTEYFPQRSNVFIQQLRQIGLFPNSDAPKFLLNNQSIESNLIELGDELSMQTDQGEIYYTLNGDDPAVSNNVVELGDPIVLIKQDADKKILIPSRDIGNDWKIRNNLDLTDWTNCNGMPGGVGYDNSSGYKNYITIDVTNQMQNNTSCYLRIPFSTNNIDLDEFNTLKLEVLYDDGFAAFINGYKVAEDNTPSTLNWNSQAVSGIEATDFISFDISAYLSNMRSGDNLLAIHALNASTSSSDFLINARLKISKEESNFVLSESAILYNEPLKINTSSNISARTVYDNEWSALTNRRFVIASDLSNLKITEIHYNPLPNDTISGKMFEFIELKNIGETTIDLAGSKFIDGIFYNFNIGDILPTNQFLVLASDSALFKNRYGISPFAQYNGNLNNDGELIEFTSATGDTIISIKYNDNDPWPKEADGNGYSLVTKDINPNNNQADGNNWKISATLHGSPGKDDDDPTDLSESELTVPIEFSLSQNYPNPFNPTTTIKYSIPHKSSVKLIVYNMLGQEIKTLVNQVIIPGFYKTNLDGHNFSSGVYFYKLTVNDNIEIKKMILLK